MSSTPVHSETWSALFKLAMQVRQMEPWTWLSETDIFAVRTSDESELAYVSVMGAIGEHLAVAVYLGNDAMFRFWSLQRSENADPEVVLEMPQLQLSFENREFLEREDLDVIKQLGLKFRGKNAWPLFRAYRPGFVPWPLSAKEAATLQTCLEQLLQVAPRLRDKPALARPDDPDQYLVRMRDASSGDWRDEFRKIRFLSGEPVRTLPAAALVRRGHSLRKVTNCIEADFFRVPATISEGKDRPFYPYILLLVESDSGRVVGQQLLHVETSLNEMLRRVPLALLEQLEGLGVRPETLAVRRGRTEDLMRPWCESLGIRVEVRQKLRALEPAKAGLKEYLSRGPRY